MKNYVIRIFYILTHVFVLDKEQTRQKHHLAEIETGFSKVELCDTLGMESR